MFLSCIYLCTVEENTIFILWGRFLRSCSANTDRIYHQSTVQRPVHTGILTHKNMQTHGHICTLYVLKHIWENREGKYKRRHKWPSFFCSSFLCPFSFPILPFHLISLSYSHILNITSKVLALCTLCQSLKPFTATHTSLPFVWHGVKQKAKFWARY